MSRKREWIDQDLDLYAEDASDPRSVTVEGFESEEVALLLKGSPPAFDSLVELTLPHHDRAEAITGVVTGLRRDPAQKRGLRVIILLEFDAREALASLGDRGSPPDDEPWSDVSPPPAQHEPEATTGARGHRPSSELSWGWVAGDQLRGSSAEEQRRSLRDQGQESTSRRSADRPRSEGEPAQAPEPLARDEIPAGKDLGDASAPEPPRASGRNLIPRGYRGTAGGQYGVFSTAGSYGLTPTPRRVKRDEEAVRKNQRGPTPPRDRGPEPEGEATPSERRSVERRRGRDGTSRRQRRERATPPNRRPTPERPPPRERRSRQRSAPSDAPSWDEWGDSSAWESFTRDRSPASRPREPVAESQKASRPSWDDFSSWDASGERESEPSPQKPTPDRRSEPPEADRARYSDPVQPRRSSPERRNEAPGAEASSYPEDAPPRKPPGRRSQSSEGVRQIESRASGERRGKAPAVVRSVEPVVGIDFGTTYSKVAVLDGKEVVLIEDMASKAATRAAVPSSIAYLGPDKIVVGEPAREYLATEPSMVISSVKRVLGLRYSDPLANGLLGSLACASRSGPHDAIIFQAQDRELTVAEVTSLILEHLVQMACDWAGSKVTKAVLTYPVDFDRTAKRELELAAKMAGIEVLELVPEPVAAVMGCGFDRRDEQTVAVYDFGGGTFDASIVKVGDNDFSVLGSAGDRWLGGDDLDELLARFVADEYNRTSGINLHNKRVEFQRLLFACEEAKRWLSTLDNVDVILPRAALTPDGPATLLVPVERHHFEDLSEDVITSSLEVCRQAAESADMEPEEVDTLLLTGGTTRIPAVRTGAQRYFNRRGVAGVHPEHAVVIGAAVRAAVLGGMPVPDDIGDRLRGQTVSGRNVGLSLADGTSEPIIDASQRPPIAAHRYFSTSVDGQTACRIELVQGSSLRTEENQPIGGFVIDGLPPRPAGETNLDIYFELSSTGTLYVTAQDRITGQRAQGTFDLSEE